MKILIADDDQDIREIIEFSFKCEIQCDVYHAASGNRAIEIIENDPEIDLIVCDYYMADGNGGKVFTYMKEKGITIPFVFCSSDAIDEIKDFSGESVLATIIKPFVFEGVQKVISDYGKKYKKKKTVITNDNDYLDIGLELLLKTKVLPCDLFVELKNGKVLKMFNKGDVFSQTEYDKYSSKGLRFLLIKKADREAYANSFSEEVEKILTDDTKKVGEKVSDAHSTIMTVVKELGFNDKVIKAATKSVDYAIGLFKESKDFKEFEKNIFVDVNNYLTFHSIAVAYVAVAVLAQTKWNSPETRKKMVLAGFLHDASIRATDFKSKENVKESDYLNFKEHPQESKELLSKLKDLPADVDRIIWEHHERPNGSGFPRGLDGTQIHPLACVFIFSHDVIDFIFYLKSEGEQITDANIHKMLSINDYSVGNFKKIQEAFLDVKIFE